MTVITMTRSEDDLSYWLRRAEQEAITAIVADGRAGSEAHRAMSRHYSALAVHRLAASSANPIIAEQPAPAPPCRA